MALCRHDIEEAACAFCKPRRRYDWAAMQARDVIVERVVTGPPPYGTGAEDQDEAGGHTTADFHGTCKGCGEDIKPGDFIEYHAGLGWVCGGCAGYEAAAT